MFGCETFGIRPDILVMSKQLSSSYLPISALLINDRVYQPLADESNRIGTFGHGYTAGGHPVPAAVALENLKIIEENDLVGNAKRVGAHMQKRLRELADHELVGEVRGVGLIAGVELVADKATRAPWKNAGALGLLVNGHLQENGVISRNMGDTLGFCPPLIITESQVDDMVTAVKKALDASLPEVKG
jgi:4-aminobutyrate--pyruvate transaminase